jgi:diguanylate cyclase (GGDEF)-like protein
VRIDQLAVLLGLVVLANLVLLAALVLPGLAARRAAQTAANGTAGAGQPAGNDAAALAAGRLPVGELQDGLPIPTTLYERIVRVVSYLFIGAALIVVTLSDTAEQPLAYVVLALGAFLIVLGQYILPVSLLGRWRYPVEAVAVIAFVSLLILLTGGHQSPFFIGYLLLLAGASLWAMGAAPFMLAILASGAYLVAINLSPLAPAIGQEALGGIAFNLVALALVSYVAAVIGREQRNVRAAALRISRLAVLTGLHNRAYLEAAIEREVLRSARSNRPFSLLMIDLDDFKAVNDRFGHESGDRLLRATAEAIRNGIRATDVAARFGGDEFVVILPDTDLAGALRVGEKLRYDVARLALRQNGDLLRSSASLGLVSYPEDGRSSGELMRRVDMAMYEAKRRGRNQLVRFARQDDSEAARQAQPDGGDVQAARATTIPIARPAEAHGAPPPAPWETRRD